MYTLLSIVTQVDASPFIGWGGSVCRTEMTWLAKYVTVSLAMKKYGALSTMPMGRDKCKSMSFWLVGYIFGRSKAVYCMSSILTQRLVYASSRSTLLRYTYPRAVFAVRNRCTIWVSAPPKCRFKSYNTLSTIGYIRNRVSFTSK